MMGLRGSTISEVGRCRRSRRQPQKGSEGWYALILRGAFEVAPIPRAQRDDPADVDARTIGRLAMAMLTGSVDPKASRIEGLIVAATYQTHVPCHEEEATAVLVRADG